MWAHRPWVGRFYPAGVRPGTELSHYVTWCNAVEGNTTFYAEPAPSTVARWAEQAPVDFRFALKVPRTVTHDRRLRDVTEPMRSFLRVVEPLGDRLGPFMVQLPGSFGPGDLDALVAFVRRLPTDRRWVLELRHPAFSDGSASHAAVDALCERHAVGRVLLDTRPLYAGLSDSPAAVEEKRTKPRLPLLLDQVGAAPVVRVIGEDSPSGTLDGLLTWVPAVSAWLDEGKEPYVFVHQPENLESPTLARSFHAAVRADVPGLTPLPEPSGQVAMW